MTTEPNHVYSNTSALIAAEAPDLPAFLFSERELHKATKVFKKGFDGLLTYAVKCNPSPHIIAQLHREGRPQRARHDRRRAQHHIRRIARIGDGQEPDQGATVGATLGAGAPSGPSSSLAMGA